MIKGTTNIISFLFKIIFSIFGYIIKGISFYFKQVDSVIKSYPKKSKKVIKIKEEIL